MTLAQDVKEEKKKPKRAKNSGEEEKRLRRFRVKAPRSFLERLDRVQTQRMYLIDRKRSDEELQEVFDIAGSTGNVSDPDCFSLDTVPPKAKTLHLEI